MTKILLPQLVITLLGGALLWYFSAPHKGISFIAGGSLILFSVFLLGWGWGLIFQKKLVALAVGVIVFNYAILGIIIYPLVKLPWFDPLWFALGVGSFAISALIYAVREGLKEGKDDVI